LALGDSPGNKILNFEDRIEMCMIPENMILSIPTPRMVIGNPGVVRGLKSQKIKGKFEAELEFLEK